MENDAISRSTVREVVSKATQYVLIIPETGRGYDGAVLIDEIMSGFDKLPALDVAPVVHAMWIQRCTSITCSNCMTVFDDEIDFMNKTDRSRPKYCPNCGAIMDKEEG